MASLLSRTYRKVPQNILDGTGLVKQHALEQNLISHQHTLYVERSA
jgi:hypothetical protein